MCPETHGIADVQAGHEARGYGRQDEEEGQREGECEEHSRTKAAIRAPMPPGHPDEDGRGHRPEEDDVVGACESRQSRQGSAELLQPGLVEEPESTLDTDDRFRVAKRPLRAADGE